MRITVLTAATMLVLTGGSAHATSTNDQTFANAALRQLHDLAIASAASERAAKDSDNLGCQDAYRNLQKAAHEALTNMHEMSFAPIDALKSVSALLRVSNISPDGCPNDTVTQIHVLLMTASQAVMGLRTDYAIGDADWYMINASGAVEARNPLRYAQSLSDQAYSWVDVRPKGVGVIGVSDWKAEMASHDVGAAIENLGTDLKVVEVGFRKNSGDDNTTVYFYRTREDALAATQLATQQAENDAKAAADVKASNAMWRQKLMSLPYLVADRDAGFKLTYVVCIPAGKNAKGQNTCRADGSYDWSDSPAVPYRWFGDVTACDDARVKIIEHPPADVDPNGNLLTYCVPAPKATGRAVTGYKMTFALKGPEAESEDTIYADLLERGSRSATVFKTFNACDDAVEYPKIMKDLGADEIGMLLSDNSKYIDLTITCVRSY